MNIFIFLKRKRKEEKMLKDMVSREQRHEIVIL
jgi:hypothetical protein